MPQNSIEQEAMERVARMYAPYSGTGRQNGRNAPNRRREEQREPMGEEPSAEEATHVDSGAKEIRTDENDPKKPGAGFPRDGKNLLEGLFEDSERSLILLLIALLQADGADPTLLLALIYLVM